MIRLLLIDNYDSFTHNLKHYLQIAGAEVDVIYNDNIPTHASFIQEYNGIVISPGPCTPKESGDLMSFLERQKESIPILGICLGMQAIGQHFGWELVEAETPVHGKQMLASHSGDGIFSNMPNPLPVARYHSLVLTELTGTDLKTKALCNNEIMSVATEDNLFWGVQFHPESILTPDGQKIINNWIAILSH